MANHFEFMFVSNIVAVISNRLISVSQRLSQILVKNQSCFWPFQSYD